MSHREQVAQQDEAFDNIYDPEMRQNVPINTAVGQQKEVTHSFQIF